MSYQKSVHGLTAKACTGQPRNHGIIPGRGKKYFTFPKCPDQLWDPHSLLFKGYWKLTPQR